MIKVDESDPVGGEFISSSVNGILSECMNERMQNLADVWGVVLSADK